jgi:Rieske Fe-S protein
MRNISGKINRRSFVRYAVLLLSGGFGVLWYKLMSKQLELNRHSQNLTVKLEELHQGSNFFPLFIIVLQGEKVKVFSNRCTHAGCRIIQEENGQFICPCHGSAFDSLSGAVTRGPALTGLTTLPFYLDKGNKYILINS